MMLLRTTIVMHDGPFEVDYSTPKHELPGNIVMRRGRPFLVSRELKREGNSYIE